MTAENTTETAGEPGLRVNELSTKSEVWSTFVRRGSARVLMAAALLFAIVRLAIGGAGRGDLIVLIVTLALAGPIEWIIHRGLLHAPEDSWTSRTLGTGHGHRNHHLDPPDIEWLMLRGIDAAVFVTAFGIVTAAWTLPVLTITGSALAGPFLTAWLLVALGLLHYEWVHLLVHTRYRCRTRYYARLARNHRRHHFRNEHYWLGVTTNSGDRVMRTYPTNAGDVPLSDTARTLS